MSQTIAAVPTSSPHTARIGKIVIAKRRFWLKMGNGRLKPITIDGIRRFEQLGYMEARRDKTKRRHERSVRS